MVVGKGIAVVSAGFVNRPERRASAKERHRVPHRVKRRDIRRAIETARDFDFYTAPPLLQTAVDQQPEVYTCNKKKDACMAYRAELSTEEMARSCSPASAGIKSEPSSQQRSYQFYSNTYTTHTKFLSYSNRKRTNRRIEKLPKHR